MECYNCGSTLTELEYCTNCGVDVRRYKKIMYTANRLYNEGLERAGVRDLTGAVRVLREALKCNKNHVEARNLLGLVYYESGETVAALSEWVISNNIRHEKNVADEYINMIQSNQGRLETINTTIHKYNVALELCRQGSLDLAMIQLKKVISMNPKYVKARRLQALLHMQKEDWEKARRELIKVLAVDCGDIDSLRYLKEAEARLGLDDGSMSGGKKKKNKDKEDEITAVYKTSGNEVIIQPMNGKEPIGLVAFLQIAIGILIGVFASYFIVMPARESRIREETSAEIVSYGEQLDAKNADIVELQTRISQLEGNIQGLKSDLNVYSGGNGVIDVYDHLLSAASAYLDKSQTNVEVEQYLSLIPEDYLETEASADYRELYELLKGLIGDSVAEAYYEEGIQAYRDMDYDKAIENLEKAYKYDDSNDNAMYYLGVAYYESGDTMKAAEIFTDFLSVFPESEQAEKARQRLEEMNE